MNDNTHDLIVIGTGTAASVVAMGCRKAGWSVAVVDHQPFGGTCALRGCDPKKMLIAATEGTAGCRIDCGHRSRIDARAFRGPINRRGSRSEWCSFGRRKAFTCDYQIPKP